MIIFSIPKQNPADKQYMSQKHLQLKTVAASMCCPQPGQLPAIKFFFKKSKKQLEYCLLVSYSY